MMPSRGPGCSIVISGSILYLYQNDLKSFRFYHYTIYSTLQVITYTVNFYTVIAFGNCTCSQHVNEIHHLITTKLHNKYSLPN